MRTVLAAVYGSSGASSSGNCSTSPAPPISASLFSNQARVAPLQPVRTYDLPYKNKVLPMLQTTSSSHSCENDHSLGEVSREATLRAPHQLCWDTEMVWTARHRDRVRACIPEVSPGEEVRVTTPRKSHNGSLGISGSAGNLHHTTTKLVTYFVSSNAVLQLSWSQHATTIGQEKQF